MKVLHNKKFRLAITIILSILFLFIAFRSLEWSKVFSSLKNYNLLWLGPAILLVIFNIFIRTVRWKVILKPIKIVKTHILFEAIMLSYFAKKLLPINIGEIVRAYLLKRKVKLSIFSVFGSIVIEKVIGILGFIIVGFLAVVFITLPPGFDEINRKVLFSLKSSMIIFFLLILLIILVKKFREKISDLAHNLSLKISKKHGNSIFHIYENFLSGLNFGISKIDLFIIILYSVSIRILFGFTTMSIARGFGIELPLLTFLFVDILVSFAHMIGGHLGIVGTYEVALAYSLSIFGVTREIGLGVALINDAVFIVPSFVIGFIYFLKEGFTIERLNRLKVLK